MANLPTNVNTSLFRFHVLKYTRDIDVSQIPEPMRMQHNVYDLIPVFDRTLFVSQGLLPEENAHLSDDDVRQYVAHMKLYEVIDAIDPDNIYHHCIIEDKMDLLPDFMLKNLGVINNVPRSYDIAHFYVYPQQSWIFNLGKVYETVPGLKGASAYTLSPTGFKKVKDVLKPMHKPLGELLRSCGLYSYTIYSDMVEHINPESDIGAYDDFIA